MYGRPLRRKCGFSTHNFVGAPVVRANSPGIRGIEVRLIPRKARKSNRCRLGQINWYQQLVYFARIADLTDCPLWAMRAYLCQIAMPMNCPLGGQYCGPAPSTGTGPQN